MNEASIDVDIEKAEAEQDQCGRLHDARKALASPKKNI